MKTIPCWLLLLGYFLTATGLGAANKYGPTGWESNPEIDWARVFVLGALSKNNPPSFGGVDVATDSEVSCYVIGSYIGERRFGGMTLTNHSYTTNSSGRIGAVWEGYLAKYDRELNFKWVQTFSNTTPSRVVVRGNNEILAVLRLQGNRGTTIGNHHIAKRTGNEAFLAKFDRDGNAQWVRRTGSSGTFGLAANLVGECYIVGNFYGAAEFENLTLHSSGPHGVYIAKFANDGELLWAKVVGSSSSSSVTNSHFQVRGATVDLANNIYVTGTMSRSSYPKGELSVHASSMSDVILAKYDSSGNTLWVAKPGGPGNRGAFNVAVDGSGYSHVVGIFTKTAMYGDQLVKTESRYHTNIFHAKYSPSGQLQWVRQFLPGDFQFNNVLSVEAYGINLTQIRSENSTKLGDRKRSTNATTTTGINPVTKPDLSPATLAGAFNNAGALSVRRPIVTPAPGDPPAVSTPSPQLNLFRSGDHLVLYWPKEFAGYVLESCDSLTPFQAWEPEVASPQVVGEWIAFTVPIDRAMKFYRLIKP